MSLWKTVAADLISAMKSKDELKASVLRMVKSAVNNYLIQKGKNEPEDSEVLEIIQKQAKQRHESIANFKGANRLDLADKEEKELEILKVYLPKQLSEQEIERIARNIIQEKQLSGKAAMGSLMKDLMPQVKGKADGKLVNNIVSRLLA